MDGTEPEPKRQRLDYNGSQRLPAGPPPPPQSHSHPGTLPPPHTYPPPQQPPPPPSPYDVGPHDQRSLPDPTPHAYVQEHSGHSTPIREQRFHPESNYSRRNSASAVARSPDGHHQYAPSRSMSTTTAADGQHYPPPQHQYPADPGGHVPAYASHDAPANGNMHHGLPMHPYDQAHGFPQPHPLEYTHSPVTAGPNPYGPNPYGVSYGSQGGSRPLKKGNRATQACDVCRTRKAKCDEGRPTCGFCQENSMPCNYQSVAPAKADRANQQIIDQLAAHKDDMRALKEDWGGRFDRIEQMLETISAGRLLSVENQEEKPPLKLESPPRRSTGDAKTGPPNAMLRPTIRDQPAVDASPTDSASNDAVATQNNAIYVEHDTAAQKLFRWRSIKLLLKQAKDLDFSDRTEDYVMNYEMNKGVLRFYGKGRQMRDSGYVSHTSASAVSPAPSSGSGPGSDEASSTGSPASSPENLWGTGFIPTIAETRPVSDVGGLNADNTLKLDPKTINRLLKSYFDNLHILHPFLKEGELTRLAEHFKQRYNPHDSSSSKASFAVPVAVDNLRGPNGPKRKHSETYYGSQSEPSLAPSPMSPKILLERSPETAIILLVMALGRICECREPLPGPVPDKDTPTLTTRPYSPVRGQTGSPPATYAMRQSPSSSSHTTGNTSAPSPIGLGRFPNSSPRSSVGELPAGARNVDVIPGLAYYAQASDILGNLTGYHELVNAQCCLLAGLYAGQLANTLESLTWIQSASRICRFLVKEPGFKNVKEPKKELIKLAFWSSLQLESDILAELDIPPSGIQEVEDVPYPKGTMDQGDFVHGETDRPAVMIYYSFQLHMRKLLNDIQKELYQEKDTNFKRATRATSLSNAFNSMIDDWRDRLPESLSWDDSAHVADNINDARLRGKFYGAQYIIHRPFLHAALDYDFEGPDIHSPPSDNPSGVQNHMSLHPAPGPEMGPPAPIADTDRRRTETVELAVKCIQAAMRSTTAFDGVLDHRRMVVTNIMGTAHAQFGNILVLSAAFKSRTLGAYVGRVPLTHLFDRTIKLLGSCAPISQTLAKDCYILKCLRKVVFEGGEAGFTNSFSSE